MLCGVCTNIVPHDYNDLTSEEVAELFSLSTALNHGRLIVHGLFARADTKNINGRVYPKSILKREVRRFRQQHIKQGTALGELNHPSYYSNYFRSLNLPNISHQVLDVFWRGRELWGTLEVLPTPAGLLLWELYSKGVKLGVSSRGWASVVADPSKQRMLVDEDFQLITFDFVTEPSNAGAYLVPICKKYRRTLPDQSAAVHVSFLGVGSVDMGLLHQLPNPRALQQLMRDVRKSRAAQSAAAAPVAQQEKWPPVPAGTDKSLHSPWLQSTGPPMPAVLQSPCAAAMACSADGSNQSMVNGSVNIAASTTSSSAAAAVVNASTEQQVMLSVLTPPPAAAMAAAPSEPRLPADTSLGGGVVLGCHYLTAPTNPWLPRDPAGRDFRTHLSLVAAKATAMQKQQEQPRLEQQKLHWLSWQHATPAAGVACKQNPQQQQQQQWCKQQARPQQQQQLIGCNMPTQLQQERLQQPEPAWGVPAAAHHPGAEQLAPTPLPAHVQQQSQLELFQSNGPRTVQLHVQQPQQQQQQASISSLHSNADDASISRGTGAKVLGPAVAQGGSISSGPEGDLLRGQQPLQQCQAPQQEQQAWRQGHVLRTSWRVTPCDNCSAGQSVDNGLLPVHNMSNEGSTLSQTSTSVACDEASSSMQ